MPLIFLWTYVLMLYYLLKNRYMKELKALEKNYGLTPADCLILEIQKPKMPPSYKFLNETQMKITSKKKVLSSPLSSSNSQYKDPKVSINQ